MASPAVFFALAVPLLLINICTTAASHTGGPIQFTYSGATGPDKWGILNPNFTACSNGKRQSPIDIVMPQAVHSMTLKPLTTQYFATNATLVNNVCNIGIKYGENAGRLILNAKAYKLKQMHWHTPSDHRLNGIQYPAELHVVHIADDGSIAVVGVLYEYGPPDPIIFKVQDELVELGKLFTGRHEDGHIALGTYHMRKMKHGARNFFRYDGSLTTPPCSENVIWTVLRKVKTISHEQVKALRAPLALAYKNNSRPVQPLNGRLVEIFDDSALLF